MLRRQAPPPPPHTCGWSTAEGRTVSNDECERCQLEDQLVLDTQIVAQKRRARTYRPARATTVERPASEIDIGATAPTQPRSMRRQTYIAPVVELDPDETLFPLQRRRDGAG